MLSRVCSLVGLVLALVLPSALAHAQDDEEAQVTEEPCTLPGGGPGTITTTRSPDVCGRGGCSAETEVVLASDEVRLLAFSDNVDEGDDLPRLSCNPKDVSVAWHAGELRFVLQKGRLKLSPKSSGAIARFWGGPPARSAEERRSREDVGVLVRVIYYGGGARGFPYGLPGVDQDTVDLMDLIAARDAIALGDYENAAGLIGKLGYRKKSEPRKRIPEKFHLFANFDAIQDGPLSATNKARLAGLERQLVAARERSAPVKLGPRRAIGGAQRILHGPYEVGAQTSMFFRGRELCVVDMPRRSPRESKIAPTRMFCVDLAANRPAKEEPYAPPASTGENLVYRDFTHWANPCGMGVAVWRGTPDGPHPCNGGPGVELNALLAVIDTDAILTKTDEGFAIVRGPGKSEPVGVAELPAVLLRSAGTQFFARSQTVFIERARLMRVGGDEKQTWAPLGDRPEGVYWVGAPLVSPDQRWVVAQSGNGDAPVTIWVFPVR